MTPTNCGGYIQCPNTLTVPREIFHYELDSHGGMGDRDMGSCHPTSPAFLHTHLKHGMRLHVWTEHTITLVSFNVVAVHSVSPTAQCIRCWGESGR